MINKQQKIIRVITDFSFVSFIFTEMFLRYTIISQFSILLFCSIFILNCLRKSKIYFDTFFTLSLLLIILSMFQSISGVSISSYTTNEMTKTLITNFFVALATYNYLIDSKDIEKNLNIFAGFGLLLSFFIAFLTFQSGYIDRFGSEISINIFGKYVSYNSNDIALISGFSFLFYLYKFSCYKKSKVTIILVWLFAIILLTGSRKGLLLLSIGALIILVLMNRKNIIKNIFLIISFGSLCYLIIFYVPFFYQVIGIRIEALFNLFNGNAINEASAATRNLYILRGWISFLEKPWLGYGFDCFRHLPYSYGTYSHNNYIELLISGGIPAFFFYYYPRVKALLILKNKWRQEKINVLFIAYLIGLLIIEIGMVSYYDRIYIIVFVFVISSYKKIKLKKLGGSVNE